MSKAENNAAKLEIRQHNTITNGRFEYSQTQLDIFFFMLSKLSLQSQNAPIRLSILELSTLTGNRYEYARLKSSTKDLLTKIFEVESEKGYIQMTMFQHIEFEKNTGEMTVLLSEKIKPFLFELKNNFTSFELECALKLTSKFAKRIYTICSQWKDIGHTKPVLISDFKKKLLLNNAGVEQFERISDFKKYVLDVAVKQINEHTDLKIDYELFKKLRTFTHIKFHIDRVKPQQAVIQFSAPNIPGPSDRQKIIRDCESIGLVPTSEDHVYVIQQCIDRPKEFFKWIFDFREGKKKNVKNPPGLLIYELGLKRKP